MIKQALLLIVLIITSACASGEQYRHQVDNDLVPYVQEFGTLIKDSPHVNKIPLSAVHFDDIQPENIGICYGMYLQHTIVYIDRAYWKVASPRQQQLLIYHELSHCICNRQHTSKSDGATGIFEQLLFKFGLAKEMPPLSDGCPASLMYPYDISERCIDNHYNYYIEEMQTGCKS